MKYLFASTAIGICFNIKKDMRNGVADTAYDKVLFVTAGALLVYRV